MNIKHKTVRGGAWDNSPHCVACAFRLHAEPVGCSRYIGFRVVRTAKSTDEPKHTKRAAYIIPKLNNRVFLLGRKKWLSEGTPWIFPGGGLCEGESSIDGAIREFYEETGSKPDKSELTYLLTERTEWSDKIDFFLWDTIEYWKAAELVALERHKFFGWMWLDITLPRLEESVIWSTLMPGAQAAIRKLRERKGSSI